MPEMPASISLDELDSLDFAPAGGRQGGHRQIRSRLKKTVSAIRSISTA